MTGIGADEQEAARETDKSLEEKEEREIPQLRREEKMSNMEQKSTLEQISLLRTVGEDSVFTEGMLSKCKKNLRRGL